MLQDLKITNGELELEFNEYTYEYTVVVPKEVTKLEFSYTLEDDCYVEIRDNFIKEDESKVYLDIYNVDELITYTFIVNRETTSSVSLIDDYVQKIELQNNNEIFNLYQIQILVIVIFLSIIIVFTLLFKPKKHIFK